MLSVAQMVAQGLKSEGSASDIWSEIDSKAENALGHCYYSAVG